MKILFAAFLIFFTTLAPAQKLYKVTFIDTTIEQVPDSIVIIIKEAMKKQFGIDTSVKIDFDNFQNPVQTNKRIVRTYKDYTIIKIDRASIEGTMTHEPPFDSIMLKGSDLYEEAPTKTGFSNLPVALPKKIFQSTGVVKKILDHTCTEYISTDSSCRIWLCPDLFSLINPGVRVKDLTGAVLAFELKDGIYFFKTEAVKMEEY